MSTRSQTRKTEHEMKYRHVTVYFLTVSRRLFQRGAEAMEFHSKDNPDLSLLSSETALTLYASHGAPRTAQGESWSSGSCCNV